MRWGKKVLKVTFYTPDFMVIVQMPSCLPSLLLLPASYLMLLKAAFLNEAGCANDNSHLCPPQEEF